MLTNDQILETMIKYIVEQTVECVYIQYACNYNVSIILLQRVHIYDTAKKEKIAMISFEDDGLVGQNL